jgi:DNA-binding MarR family transcriptional regulator
MKYDELINNLNEFKLTWIKIIKEIKIEGLYFSDFIVFKKICCNKRPYTMSELSELTGFSNTMITFSIDTLEKKGYVHRKKGSDKRTTYVVLSDEGIKYCNYIEVAIEKKMKKVFDKISEEDYKKIVSYISELNKLLQKYFGE